MLVMTIDVRARRAPVNYQTIADFFKNNKTGFSKFEILYIANCFLILF